MGSGGDRPGFVSIRVGSERSDALEHCAGGLIVLDDASARAGNVQSAVGEHRMEHGLPEISRRSGSFPISGERKHLDQLAISPGELALAPGLGGVTGGVVNTGLEFHVHVVAVYERSLKVRDKIAAVGGLFVRSQWIVDNVRQDAVQVLTPDVSPPASLPTLPPL